VPRMAVRAIRRERKIPLNKIREAVAAAEDRFGVTFPFARQHRTFVFNEDIVLELEDGRLVGLSGKYKAQDLIRPVVELYMSRLEFDADGLARIYRPMQEDAYSVVLDPDCRFGAPVVDPTGYTVDALVNAVRTEGSIEAAAQAYDVEIASIRLALQYDDYLAGVAA
jgi:uncharacterized protein (DUF433 family)